MAEKDAAARLRRAVKENNLFLVKRLIQRTDMRNPDPAPKRYTSLAWAAVSGREETFEFLLTAGHDDEELSRDSENNTILMLLADFKPPPSNPYEAGPSEVDLMGAALRMAKLYYERYPWILDWSNVQGKTALHMAAMKGNEELVRMLCDLGADFDLNDNQGNTPLHYASAWGHIPVVQLLIERGCSYTARNNQGFIASDYAYSHSTKETLLETVRIQFENHKKSRRLVYAQAAQRGNERGHSPPFDLPSLVPPKTKDLSRAIARMRSGSNGSRTTATSDSGEIDAFGPGQETSLSSLSGSSSSTSQPTKSSSLPFSRSQHPNRSDNMSSASSTGTFSIPSPGPSQPLSLNPTPAPPPSLSPIVNRMRERDADAMEAYMRRNRSGSAGTSSITEPKSQSGLSFASAGPSANGDDITALNSLGSTCTRKLLRPSFSAAQLRSRPPPTIITTDTSDPPAAAEPSRTRAGTNPINMRPNGKSSLSSIPPVSRTSSSDIPRYEEKLVEEPETFTGPPSQYARFPEPPLKSENYLVAPSTPTPTISSSTSTSTISSIGRRLPFHLLSKPTSTLDTPTSPGSHRRGSSTTSVRS